MSDQSNSASSAPDSSKGFSLRHVFSAAIGKAKDAFNSVTSPSLRYGLLTLAPGAFGAMAVAAGIDPKIVITIQFIFAFRAAGSGGVADIVVPTATVGAAITAATADTVGTVVGVSAGLFAGFIAGCAAEEEKQDPKPAKWGAGIGTLTGAALMAFTIHTHAPDFQKPRKTSTVSIDKQSEAPVLTPSLRRTS